MEMFAPRANSLAGEETASYPRLYIRGETRVVFSRGRGRGRDMKTKAKWKNDRSRRVRESGAAFNDLGIYRGKYISDSFLLLVSIL